MTGARARLGRRIAAIGSAFVFALASLLAVPSPAAAATTCSFDIREPFYTDPWPPQADIGLVGIGGVYNCTGPVDVDVSMREYYPFPAVVASTTGHADLGWGYSANIGAPCGYDPYNDHVYYIYVRLSTGAWDRSDFVSVPYYCRH